MAGNTRWIPLVVFIVLCSIVSAEESSFETCLRRDSISCVQIHIYKKLRALFSQDSINLLGGFQLVKGEGERSLEDNTVDDKIYGDSNVSERQSALEEFAYDQIANFFNVRTFRWGITPAIDQVATTARMAVSSMPQDLKEKISTYLTEGRGKKKILKSLIPILILAKMKLVSMMSLAFLIVSIIAKKALITASIALAITLFISIKKLLAKHHSPVYYEVHSESHHGPPPSTHPDRSGWAPPASWSSWDSYDLHGSHSSPHHLAYSPPKPSHR